MAVFELRACIKNYAWGKLGLDSTVAKLYKSAFKDFKVDDKSPYSELWMGTHTSGPSTIPSQGNMPLLDWLNSNQDSLGSNIINLFGRNNGLPFLFKVLSVNKALSIQVHPNKETAEKLHTESSDHYPDDNHKPEMAIALTEFEALCGFRPIDEIMFFLTELPQLLNVIGEDVYKKFLDSNNSEGLKMVFSTLMSCEEKVFQPLLSDLVEYFKTLSLGSKLSKSTRDNFLSIYAQYPGDIGCFCIFFLNYLKLNPGEAIFLAANEPHAYLKGDCVECMARSDNVVRAGLTPKFKDVKTLCDILTYQCRPAHANIFQHQDDPSDPCVKIFNPPVKDFAVDLIMVPPKYDEEFYLLKSVKSASILLVVEGEGKYKHVESSKKKKLIPGTVLFISSGSKVEIETLSELLMFRAYVKDIH